MSHLFKFLEKKVSALGVEDYEFYAVETRPFSVESKEGSVESFEEAVEHGMAVRLFKNGKCGFACSSDWSEPLLEKTLRLAAESLQIVEEAERLTLPNAAEKEKTKPSPSPDRAAAIQMAIDLERFAKQYDPRIRRVRSAAYSEEVRTVWIQNSRGAKQEAQQSRFELSLMVMAEEGKNQEMAWESETAPLFSDLHPQTIAEKAAEKAVSQLGGIAVKTQKAPAVLDSVVATSLLGVVASSFFADQVQKNRSALKEKRGQSFYSPAITVVDDGRLPGGYATFPFDGEGVLTRRQELVRQGVVQDFLYDLQSAVREKRHSTGSGLRPSFKEPPRVGPTNFFVEATGSLTLEQLLEEMGEGFWVRDVIGVHTADAISGDFSLGASGFWIDKGRRKHPVRGVTISGNLHELLRRVDQTGGKLRFYHSFGAPPLLVNELDIGGH